MRKPRDTVGFLMRMKPELHERLRVAAEERDLPMTWLANRAIERLLDELIPADEWSLTREETA